MDILVCYEVGINNGALASGSAFVEIDRLTRASLRVVSDDLRQLFIDSNPGISSVQNLVFRSIVKMDFYES